jgi:hypothetical protein
VTAVVIRCLLVVFAILMNPSVSLSQPTDVQQGVNIMVRLCVAGGTKFSVTADRQQDILVKSEDTRKEQVRINIKQSEAEGLVDGINNALTQVAATEAAEVRKCLQPVRERVLEILFPSPKKIVNSAVGMPKPEETASPGYNERIPNSDVDLIARSDIGRTRSEIRKLYPKGTFAIENEIMQYKHNDIANFFKIGNSDMMTEIRNFLDSQGKVTRTEFDMLGCSADGDILTFLIDSYGSPVDRRPAPSLTSGPTYEFRADQFRVTWRSNGCHQDIVVSNDSGNMKYEAAAKNKMAGISVEGDQTVTNENGPLAWDGDLGWLTTGDNAGPIFLAMLIVGHNKQASEVHLNDAYIVSGNTGETRLAKVDAGPAGKVLPREINPIPPGAAVALWIDLPGYLHEKDLLQKWGKVYLHVELDGRKYNRLYSEQYMRDQLSRFPNPERGPHVTRKTDETNSK